MTILEFAETIRDARPAAASPIVFQPLPEDDPQTRQPDITLARTRLGWEPKVALAEGLERTIALLPRRPRRRPAVAAER